jgi:signal peptidase complex subunit 1
VFLTGVQIISFVVGYSTENVYNALFTGLGGAVITMLVCVPPWPFLNRNPVKWLPARKIAGYWVENPDEKKSS